MRLLTAIMLAFVMLGLAGSGCASGEANISTQRAAPEGGLGTCNPNFCGPAGIAKGCCVGPNGPCGLDFGNGCVSRGGDGG